MTIVAMNYTGTTGSLGTLEPPWQNASLVRQIEVLEILRQMATIISSTDHSTVQYFARADSSTYSTKF
jgi:hypothetical protein